MKSAKQDIRITQLSKGWIMTWYEESFQTEPLAKNETALVEKKESAFESIEGVVAQLEEIFKSEK